MTKDNGSEDIRKYQEAWASLMIDIWQEKVRMLRAVSKGGLLSSFSSSVAHSGTSVLITLKFAEYGFYVDSGTGYGFRKGNGGNAQVMDPAYRRKHRLDVPRKRGPGWGGGYTSGNPRKKRPWFNKKYYASVMKLKEAMERIYGDDFEGLIADALRR